MIQDQPLPMKAKTSSEKGGRKSKQPNFLAKSPTMQLQLTAPTTTSDHPTQRQDVSKVVRSGGHKSTFTRAKQMIEEDKIAAARRIVHM